MNEVKVPISNDPITGNQRELKMKRLIFQSDLEASLEMEIHELNEQGQSFFEVAKNLNGLTEAQRNVAMQKHFPIQLPEYTTRGAFVNSATNQIDDNGDITEKQSLFSITIGQLKALTAKDDNDSALEALFEIVKSKMLDTNNRGRN
jgi:hypothetical protein